MLSTISMESREKASIEEDFCQSDIFQSLIWKNTNICLVGVLKWKKKEEF